MGGVPGQSPGSLTTASTGAASTPTRAGAATAPAEAVEGEAASARELPQNNLTTTAAQTTAATGSRTMAAPPGGKCHCHQG